MSWQHQTLGWQRYEAFVFALKTAGISVLEVPECGLEQLGQPLLVRGYDLDKRKQRLRIAHFTTTDGKQMMVEEWLKVDDHHCDGVSLVDIAVYPEGLPPILETKTLQPR